MNCQRCASDRILMANSHASDLHHVSLKDTENDGYLPYDLGIGGGDDMEIKLCLDCGQLQGQWPLPMCKLEKKSTKSTSNRWKCPACGWDKNPRIADECDDCGDDRPAGLEPDDDDKDDEDDDN